jgi:hypothetical protein
VGLVLVGLKKPLLHVVHVLGLFAGQEAHGLWQGVMLIQLPLECLVKPGKHVMHPVLLQVWQLALQGINTV